MANSTGSYGVSFVDLVDGAVAVVGVVSTVQKPQNKGQCFLAHNVYGGKQAERP